MRVSGGFGMDFMVLESSLGYEAGCGRSASCMISLHDLAALGWRLRDGCSDGASSAISCATPHVYCGDVRE